MMGEELFSHCRLDHFFDRPLEIEKKITAALRYGQVRLSSLFARLDHYSVAGGQRVLTHSHSESIMLCRRRRGGRRPCLAWHMGPLLMARLPAMEPIPIPNLHPPAAEQRSQCISYIGMHGMVG